MIGGYPGLGRQAESIAVRDLARGMLWLVWQVIRLPILAMLVILEPIAVFALGGLALLGVLMSLLFELSGVVPDFPFWTMLAISVGFGIALKFYHALIRVLSA